jgi:solute carrier family 39 (zinc transporter), member 1/2/3
MTIFLMFFIELMAARFDVFGESGHAHDIEAAGPSISAAGKREKYSDSNMQVQSGK